MTMHDSIGHKLWEVPVGVVGMAAGGADAAFNVLTVGGKGLLEGGIKEAIKGAIKEFTKEGGEKVTKELAKTGEEAAKTGKDAAKAEKADKAAKEPAQLSRGKRAHKAEPVRPGERAEVQTPSGKRMDRYNEEKGHIREIKPNNQRALRHGEKQVQNYKKEMEQATGRPHTTEVTPYDPTKYNK
jgi:hypothetical protein